MRCAWGNFQSISSIKQMMLPSQLHRQLAGKHINKIAAIACESGAARTCRGGMRSSMTLRSPLRSRCQPSQTSVFNSGLHRLAHRLPPVKLREFLRRRRSRLAQPALSEADGTSPHSGIFPCFLGGFLSRLPSSISSAAIRRRRVSCGKITASTYPRSAAM
jgi:hypothetical protein